MAPTWKCRGYLIVQGGSVAVFHEFSAIGSMHWAVKGRRSDVLADQTTGLTLQRCDRSRLGHGSIFLNRESDVTFRRDIRASTMKPSS